MTDLPLMRNRLFLLTGLVCLSVFAFLMVWRLGWITAPPHPAEPPRAMRLQGGERWMKILQGPHTIGHARSQLLAEPTGGYHFQEDIRLRLNTMGLVQDIQMHSQGRLDRHLALERFALEMHSGLFKLEADGHMEQGALVCRLTTDGPPRNLRIPFDRPPYLPAGIFPAVAAAGLQEGATHRFPIFDPASMSAGELEVRVGAVETIAVEGREFSGTRVTLNFKGLQQNAWIDAQGAVLVEEGLLGLRQVAASREEIEASPLQAASDDLTRRAAVVPEGDRPGLKHRAWIRYRIQGVAGTGRKTGNGRQHWQGPDLRVVRESLDGLPAFISESALAPAVRVFLAPSPLVQSDDPRIRELAAEVTAGAPTPLAAMQRLVAWIQAHVEKRPVLSLPDALSTLTHRRGDCNEHAALMAALARAAGYPAQIEAGVVYLDGRFYYHAWNRVYLGRWITVDPLTGEIPADATHIALARGEVNEQADLVAAIGRLQIQILETASP